MTGGSDDQPPPDPIKKKVADYLEMVNDFSGKLNAVLENPSARKPLLPLFQLEHAAGIVFP